LHFGFPPPLKHFRIILECADIQSLAMAYPFPQRPQEASSRFQWQREFHKYQHDGPELRIPDHGPIFLSKPQVHLHSVGSMETVHHAENGRRQHLMADQYAHNTAHSLL
jgi:hypothetical protein